MPPQQTAGMERLHQVQQTVKKTFIMDSSLFPPPLAERSCSFPQQGKWQKKEIYSNQELSLSPVSMESRTCK